MIEIKVSEEYKLTSDPMNVIVNQRAKDKEGNLTDNYRPLAFCKNLESACVFLLNHNINSSEAKTFKELAEVVEAAKNQIIKAVSTWTP